MVPRQSGCQFVRLRNDVHSGTGVHQATPRPRGHGTPSDGVETTFLVASVIRGPVFQGLVPDTPLKAQTSSLHQRKANTTGTTDAPHDGVVLQHPQHGPPHLKECDGVVWRNLRLKRNVTQALTFWLQRHHHRLPGFVVTIWCRAFQVGESVKFNPSKVHGLILKQFLLQTVDSKQG